MSINRMLTIGSVVAVALSLPFFGRTWNVVMHEVGAVLFVGNLCVSAVWMSVARRARSVEALRLGIRGILVTDAVFTNPGAILVLLNGGIVATPYFQAHATWVFVGLGLFLLSGVVWAATLVPTQKRLAVLLDATPPGAAVPPQAELLVARWFRFGAIATLLPLVTLVIMVVKPAW